jgi:hypothetical protein
MMSDEPIILSEEGRLRQRQILDSALCAARSRKIRRTAIRAASVGIGCLVIAALLLSHGWKEKRQLATIPVSPALAVVHEHPATFVAPIVVVQRIQTDPNVVERLALPPIHSTVRHISEDELLRELADAHQSAGIISVDGKARLIFR